MHEIFHYETKSGKNVFAEWVESLRDVKAAARIAARIERLSRGLFGDCRHVGDSVWELRVDWGAGYRVYYSKIDNQIVLLLSGGDKSKQQSDIESAIENLKDWKNRNGKAPTMAKGTIRKP